MADDSQCNIVLERLREIRVVLDDIKTTQSEHGRRLTGIDLRLADMRRTLGHDEVLAAEQSQRIDRLNERLGRVERRLELRDDAERR